MVSKNLWGDISSVVPMRTPTTILKEQATALTEMTKGILYGKVTISTSGDEFEIVLYILAPAINNYRFDVVYVTHKIQLYPAEVVAAWDRYSVGKAVKCQNEDQLINALQQVLGSKQVTEVLTTLVSQSKSMK